MSHNFKPGDLALIIGASHFKESIGKVCELVEFHSAGQEYSTPQGEMLVSPGGCWLVSGSSISGGFIQFGRLTRTPGQALVDEKNLMPLRGDFAPEQQKSQEVAA